MQASGPRWRGRWQTDPELLLLDEPFSNLDVDSAKHMVELLMEFRTRPVSTAAAEQGARGRTIILTTHQAHWPSRWPRRR